MRIVFLVFAAALTMSCARQQAGRNLATAEKALNAFAMNADLALATAEARLAELQGRLRDAQMRSDFQPGMTPDQMNAVALAAIKLKNSDDSAHDARAAAWQNVRRDFFRGYSLIESVKQYHETGVSLSKIDVSAIEGQVEGAIGATK